MITTTFPLAPLTWLDDNDSCEGSPDFCVGNSRAWIVRDTSRTTAICACGYGLYRAFGNVYRHIVNDSPLCPPYTCKDCGAQHNSA